jgi:hypothetical protein
LNTLTAPATAQCVEAFPNSDAAAVEGKRADDGTIARLIFVALLVLQALFALLHTPWRDELQALMIAEHSASLADLIRNLHYEGHPALWYLLLRVGSFASPSPQMMTVLQVIVALAIQTTIWFSAPFSPWIRILLGANYFIFFEYGVLAREYGLGCLAFFLFLRLRRSLAGWLLLALMANVDFHFGLLSIACVGFLVMIEKRWSWAGFFVWLAGCAIAALCAMPARDAAPAVHLPQSAILRLVYFLETSSALLMPVDPSQHFRWAQYQLPAPALGIGLGFLVPVCLWFAIKDRPRDRALLILLYVGVLACAVTIYPAYARHLGVILLFLIGLEWSNAESNGAAFSRFALVWFSSLAVFGLCAAIASTLTPFTRIDDIVGWINTKRLAAAPWAADPPWYGVDLSASLDGPTYDVRQHCDAWFEHWRKGATHSLDQRELAADLVAGARANGGMLFLMSDKPIPPLSDATATRLARFPQSMTEGPISLYRITSFPGSSSKPVACR